MELRERVAVGRSTAWLSRTRLARLASFAKGVNFIV